MKKLYYILLLVICSCYMQAQTTKFYSTEQGLSNSLINQIYQDKKGFIWIATEDGLNRFDGMKFTTYRNISGDTTSLKNNYVRCLFEDSMGNFYIGCINGLMKYDRNTNRFSEVKMLFQKSLQQFPHVTRMIENHKGDVWIATSGSGLFVIKKGENGCNAETEINSQLNNLFLTAVFEDSRRQLWIGSETACWVITEAGRVIQVTDKNVSSICEDNAGHIFIGSLYAGLTQYDLADGRTTVIPDSKGNRQLPMKITLFSPTTGNLYIGTDGNGMKIYDSSVLENYEPASTPFDFSKAKVHSLIEDKDGNLWAGLFQKGVFFIPHNPNGFQYYGYKSFQRNNIGSNSVMSIFKDKDSVIWVGTDNDGLYAIHNQTKNDRHFEHSENPASVPSTILSICEETGGRLWLGSYLNGLALFDPASGKCRYFTPNRVYCLKADDKGHLWIGTYGNGLYEFDRTTQTVVNHFMSNEVLGIATIGLPNNWISALFLDEKGLLWLGTYKGLSCMDTQNHTFITYTTDNSSLPSNVVLAVNQDKNGVLWIGTDNGLASLNKQTQEMQVFRSENGLGSTIICAIEADEQNNIWLSTHSGISKYSPAENSFTNYYTSDGLQGTEFTRGAAFQSTAGEIFFGGINGITCFYPQNIHAKKQQLNVFITQFYLFGQPVYVGQKSGKQAIFNRPLLDNPDINLASYDNVFSIELSTLEYGNPESIRYFYQLEGFDTQWTANPPGNNRITYTNLSHGKYKLHFYAADKENQSEIKTIQIQIRPAFYQTFIAKLIYLLLFLLIICAVYFYVKQKIQHRHEILRMEHAEQISQAKLQFFTNISHEIRTPMTLILGPLEKLLSTNKDQNLQQTYLLIYRNAQRILRLINQLMDMRKLDRGQMQLRARETDLVGFIKDVMHAFEYSANNKNIRFSFHHEMPDLKAWIDINNFDKVLYNIFSNAFKFTPENGEIDVFLTTGDDFFEIKIQDSGIGIDESDTEKIFDRFYQANQDTLPNYGTGIGLHLTRSLVELHHGTIHASARKDRSGAIFTLRLPLEQEHPNNSEQPVESDKPEVEKIVRAKTNYRILIVEDDHEINHYIKSQLQDQYKIQQTYNGKEALDYILKEKPDLIISDIMMAEMDGINLTKKVKSNIQTEHIPVILLTAKTQDEDRIAGLKTGADLFMVKPFNPEVLKSSVAGLLDNRERLKGKFQSQSEGKIDKIEVKSANELLMERILKAINENINNPEFTVEALSSAVGMSRVHLHRKLKELTNQSARDFIRNIRLTQAGELLHNKNLSISDVAFSVGFSTLSHFSASFKEFSGISPKEYMENLK
ncbi:hybrid sensor histidine kinase/response regulator [Bacteroidia bacterium]|nr:hybrid sensor histidine kinase/response regulator [Bacteroidia bacterium]